MKIICISDTHGMHGALELPKGDMIIHAGDVSKRGYKNQIVQFLKWFSKLDYQYKVFIAGNHDFFLEGATELEVNSIIPSNVIYLNDSGVKIEGINIWGSPIQPWFLDWAFNRDRGPDIQLHWDLIPKDTDILITHGPVFGLLDLTVRNDLVGCEDLLKTIKKIKPKYHVCGHIHEAYGRETKEGIEFINASVVDVNYDLVNEPVVIEI